jgi:hypothetical protein
MLWSLTNSNLGTALSASGNSNPNGWNAQNASIRTTLDLRDVTDVWIAVATTAAPTGTLPTLQVQLDVFDDQGNLFPQALKLAAALSTGPAVGSVSGGLHSGLVLPSWGQIAWTLGGSASPAFPGVEISVFGR